MRLPPSRRRSAHVARSVVAGLAAISGCVSIGGCSLFNQPVGALFTRPVAAFTPGDEYDEDDPPMRGPFRPVIDQIALEVLLVERPADDPLLGRALWDSVGEVGAVDADRAERLRAAGFRVGVASADPPEAVRALIERRETIGAPLPGTRLGNDERTDGVSIQRVPLRAGGETALPTAPSPGELIVVTPASGDRPARTESFDTATGSIRVTSRAPQKGWVTFELTPEIHHGPTAMRAAPGAAGLETSHGQRVRAWPDRSFEVTLTVGDSIILGLRNDAAPDSLAAAMLAAEKDGHATDRVLVVRLADVRQIEGRSSKR
ncbi:hypothetical protein [Alienimonas chondri]|uniref:Uncharacterized protein n=1 Tax=Alienimonas chondri TaxID=2681879 RepID=A0ABX1VGA9_9PLAN|nr:hypothetical protein [Alienimonas chondri]NNJ26872.1 hypothetical protein [Alienimonas chondri]